MTRKKLVMGLCVMLFITIALDQGIQFFALADGHFMGRRAAPFDPPLFQEDQEDWYKRLVSHVQEGQPPAEFFKLDAELGWCPPKGADGAMGYDWSGSRMGFEPLPHTKSEGVTRVLAIGCSFTRGDEVQNTETWAAYLDRDRDDLEIANMGVGAYGIDQALMRMRRDGLAVEPDEVWLGILPWASPRTTNVYRPALRHWCRAPAFKPRFILDEQGELQLIPNPAPTLEAAERLLSNQKLFLEAVGEYDARIRAFKSCWAPAGSRLSHYSGLARLALSFRESRAPLPPELLGDKDSECYQLMRKICLQTLKEAEAAGARFRILILPGRQDLRQRAAGTEAYWSAFVNELRENGVEVIDLSDTLVEAGALQDDKLWAEGQHYSPAANRIVADGLLKLIKL